MASMIEVKKLHTLLGHRDSIYTIEGGMEQNTFYSGGGDGMVAQWYVDDPENGRLLAKLDTSVYALCLVKELNVLIIGQNFDGIHLVDLNDRKNIGSLKLTDKAIFDIKYYNGKIYVACGDGHLYIVNYDGLSIFKKLLISNENVRCIAINEPRGHMAVGCSDHTIKVFDLNSSKPIHDIKAHKNSVFSVVYSANGKYLLSTGRDAHLKVWDANEDYLLKESIVAHMYAINHISVSPDGKFFATCSMDKSVKIWDYEKMTLLKVIDKARYAGHGTSVNKLFWSSYQNQLVSCSDDRSISIWDIKMGV